MSDSPHLSWLERLSHFLSREPHSQKQLIEMLHEAHNRELIDRDALQMIEGVLAVSEKQTSDIMVPRPQMVVVDAEQHPIDALPTIIQSQHSRFPVIGDTPDKVDGILLAKDLLPFTLEKQKSERTIRDLLRPAVFVPETKPLDILLKEFRQDRNHMAIVVDEYGSVSGLVTIEDILEEIVGEIEDEYDTHEKEPLIKPAGKNTFWVNAFTPIGHFNEYFNTDFTDSDFDTIGGLIVHQFGHLPKRNEKIHYRDFEIIVMRATRRGIQALQFKKSA